MWTSHQIRTAFLGFFAERGHTVVRSSSLIPDDDPTLLFTNAGMNQFKNIFTGREKRDYTRATSVQKCLRAGGKHNDLENVGYTTKHHTFFEMLGNFSFGDYFKADAIVYAWEFVTGVLNLPANRLYATVHENDDEAFALWHKIAPDLQGRVLRFGDQENFWSMGEFGPCGPCSEVHYDRGDKFGCGKSTCGINCECDRFVELWNLVFMQYERDESGKMTPLPKPSVDTGAGLERIAAVMQGVNSNFEIDTIHPIIAEIERFTGKKYFPDQRGLSHRVIADHIRALVFAFADGALPSNEGRGYVLRRILRRAARHGRLLDIHEPFIFELAGTVNFLMGRQYPEIAHRLEHIREVIDSEEERFNDTLDAGLLFFEGFAKEALLTAEKTISGQDAFRLYDTFGFPIDLTELLAREKGLKIDLKGFEVELEKQRTRSRTVGQRTRDEELDHIENLFKGLKEKQAKNREIEKRFENIPPTEFDYENLVTSAKVTEVFQIPGKADEFFIYLDKTTFYLESGGQVSDTGMIASELDRSTMDILSLGLYPFDKRFHHARIREGKADFVKKSLPVKTIIDIPRRRAIMRNHTATHLVHKALRTVLGEHVHQAGSLVAPDRLRFDFTHFRAVSEKDLAEIEQIVNDKILENLVVWAKEESQDYARNVLKAMALFGEKYGERVRVIHIGEKTGEPDSDYSTELCGGTHVKATGEIGLLKIISESGIAAGVRRLEAVTGLGLFQLATEQRKQLFTISEMVKTTPEQLGQRIDELISENRALQRQLEEFKTKQATRIAEQLISNGQDVRGVRVVTKRDDSWTREDLLFIADSIKLNATPAFGTLATAGSGNGFLIVQVASESAIRQAGLKANLVMQELSRSFGLSGGGKPDLAQGGGKDVGILDNVLNSLPATIQKIMS